jgi:ferredoxin
MEVVMFTFVSRSEIVKERTMKAIVDQDTCIGCALCPQVCPEVFKMEEDKAVVFTDPVPPAVEGKAREAAEQCPVNAITIG